MSELHQICRLQRPISETHLETLKAFLKAGVPSTYTTEEAENYEKGIEDQELSSTTTPLHLICEHIPVDFTEGEAVVIGGMMDELFLRGAGWCLCNEKQETPGCILARRKLNHTIFWDKIVDAGVRAEVLLRKVADYEYEFIEGDDALERVDEEREGESDEEKEKEKEEEKEEESGEKQEESGEKQEVNLTENDPSCSQSVYLNTPLEYKKGALVTKDRKDGVMMSWEEQLMQAGCDSLFSSESGEINTLNIGFGMGIIDTMINSRSPAKQYICEAHPDVLAEMKRTGWFDKPNVVVLSGRWQETLPELLTKGVFFDGIYYDTYSEHYEDMLELFDLVVGLLKPEGCFSFFNGLGADRLVVYEVYRKIVELDLSNYGMNVTFRDIPAPQSTLGGKEAEGSVWSDIKRAYWTCPIYYHPEARFA